MKRVDMVFFLLHYFPQYQKQPSALALMDDQQIQEIFENAFKELVHEEEFREFLQARWERKKAEYESKQA